MAINKNALCRISLKKSRSLSSDQALLNYQAITKTRLFKYTEN